MRYKVCYGRSRDVHAFAKFISPSDTKSFLAMIRKAEPGVIFVAVNIQTGEREDW